MPLPCRHTGLLPTEELAPLPASLDAVGLLAGPEEVVDDAGALVDDRGAQTTHEALAVQHRKIEAGKLLQQSRAQTLNVGIAGVDIVNVLTAGSLMVKVGGEG